MLRLAASRVGVKDYRNLIDEKLRTAGELYQFMVDQFHNARAVLLELAVFVILVIELIFLFQEKWRGDCASMAWILRDGRTILVARR